MASSPWPLADLARRGVTPDPTVWLPDVCGEAWDEMQKAVGHVLSLLQTDAALDEFGRLTDEADEEGNRAWLARQVPGFQVATRQIVGTFLDELAEQAVDGVLAAPRWPRPPVRGRVAETLWWRGVRVDADELESLVDSLWTRSAERTGSPEPDAERAAVLDAVNRGTLPQAAWDEYRARETAQREEQRMARLRELVDEVCRVAGARRVEPSSVAPTGAEEG